MTRKTAREQLLEVGFALLARGDVALGQIKLTELTEAAGLSNGAFYHVWPGGLEDFRRDLAEHALREDHSTYVLGIRDALGETGSEASIRDLCKVFGREDSTGMDDDMAFRAQISMWPLAFSDPQVASALRDAYGRFTDDVYVPMYTALFEAQGLEFRPPFDARLFAVAVTAMTEGLTLRRLIDRDSLKLPSAYEESGWDLFGLLLAIIAGAVLKDKRSTDARDAVEAAYSSSGSEDRPALERPFLSVEALHQARSTLEATIEELQSALERVIRAQGSDDPSAS